MSEAEAGAATAATHEPTDVVALERALIERAQRGDRVALKRWLQRHSDALFNQVILPRVGDYSAAEDILKATMVTAIEKLGRFQWQGRSGYFWLRQIAANKVIDHHRASQRRRRLADALVGEAEAKPSGPSPERALIAGEEQRINRARIGAALAKLNDRYRRAIELRLIEELPREVCAERMEITVNNFDVLLFRAVRSFRKAFGER